MASRKSRLVLPSPIDAPPGNDSWEFTLDAAEGMAQVDAVLNQGPVGPRGASAYELAQEAGYEGSEAEWLAELQGAAAAANEAKVSAAEALRHEQIAEEFKYNAGAAKVSAENSAIAAEASASRAAEMAEAAASCSAAAARGASTAEAEASRAAARAEAAATSASVAQEASAAAQEAVEAAEEKAALLGDAALCSGNNVFDGGNVFNGPLAMNGLLEVTGDFSWGGFGADWREDVWLACCGTNPRSKGCTTFSEWMVLNPDWAQRQRLVIYMPATGAHVFDNIKPEGEGVCEECVYVGKCISYEAQDACYLAFGSRKWTIFMTGTVIRGFAGLSTVEELSLFMPWGQFAGSAAFGGLGRKAQRCVLRVFAPVAKHVHLLFQECYWTELVLEVPALENSFSMGRASTPVGYEHVRQVVEQVPVVAQEEGLEITANVDSEVYAGDADGFEGLVATAAGRGWSLVYVLV